MEDWQSEFQSELPKEFQTEYGGDSNRARREMKKLRLSGMNDWDKLLEREERRKIRRLDVAQREQCVYLKLARGAELLHYCEAYADKLLGEMVKYTGRVATKESAEFISRCLADELDKKCLGNCDCEIYREVMTRGIE
jgi:hypothetical protein